MRARSRSTLHTLTTIASTIALMAGFLVVASPAQAATYTGPVDCTSGTAQITSGIVTGNTNCAGALILPAGTIEVGSRAFEGAVNLESVSFPDSVFEIRSEAFKGATKLTRLLFTGNQPSVGSDAFLGISSIATVSITEGATFVAGATAYQTGDSWNTVPYLVRAPDVACSNGGYVDLTATEVTSVTSCTGSVEIPSGITVVGDAKFQNQSALTQITLPASLTTIGVDAFRGATALARFVFLGNAPANIDWSSFQNVPYLATASISATATGFNTSMTGAQWNVLWVVKTPDFACSNGGWVAVESSTNTVKDGGTCRGIAVIPDGITSIDNISAGYGSFERNTRVTEISLPDSLTKIGVNSFYQATGLRTVTFRDPSGSALTAIENNAFRFASSLTSIYIPSGVGVISDSAFGGASSLSSVTFEAGSTLTSIGADGFGSTALTAIEIPATVTHIGGAAFVGSANLATVKFLGSTAPSLGSNVFIGVKSGAVAEVLDGATGFGPVRSLWNNLVVKIENQSTEACSGGGYIVIDTTTPASPSLMFSSNDCAGTVTVPAEITFIENNAFENGSPDRGQITSIFFESGSLVTTIGEAAFAGLDRLSTISLPSLLQTIGDRAFDGAELLTEITLPASVTSIGDNAFAGIEITGVTFLGEAPTIDAGDFPFVDAPSSARVYVSSAVTGFGVSGATWNGLTVIQSPDLACSTGGWVSIVGTVLESTHDCTGLIVIPTAITEIERGAFGESSVTTVRFAAGSLLTKIGSFAFRNTPNLTAIEIPAGVHTIDRRAFQITAWSDDSRVSRAAMLSFTVDPANTSFESVGGVLFNQDRTRLIAYPGAATATSYAVPSTVTEISESAFSYASNITSIEFLGNAPTVGSEAFRAIGASATARVTFAATGFTETGGLWEGLTLVRATAVSPKPSTLVPTPMVSPKQIALRKIVAELLQNGVPVLKGTSASKRVLFTALSSKLDATAMTLLREVVSSYKGLKGKLVLVGFVRDNGQSKTSARALATTRAKNVAQALVQLGIDVEIEYAGFGSRNKLKPKTTDNRVAIRWVAAE